jgi:putative membrane protein
MMKRLGFSLLAIIAVAVGLVIGTFNAQKVSLDLLWVQVDWPLGLILLTAFAIGAILGLIIVYFVQVLPLRVKLRRANSTAVRAPNPDPSGDDA